MAADMKGAAVRISDVRKSYGQNQVLSGVSIDVAAGEVLVICGPSGCGKSTLLRCINGLETIQGGNISVSGVDVDHRNPDALKRVRQMAGMVFQNFNLFPHMTVLDNISIAPVKVMGVAPDVARQEAQALLASVGMSEKASVFPYQLSGGQRQRVAIARALAMKPSVMLFDEPTSALDPEMREEVLSVIRRVHAERNMTMIVVTHEIGFAKSVASHAILMEAGQIVEQAPARQFFDNPQSERARRFVLAIKND
ncbi:MAG TPA: amino acid ABC transporter ATP-binding protein [Burkholderiaceae bacterium]|nr:amino acid ABC transporter ATP-binding protein [Burkholderiaceae bacterium]HRA61428.1 amino acid ABC transporter ATP-binding protein [Burkholderiaceae bacterium]